LAIELLLLLSLFCYEILAGAGLLQAAGKRRLAPALPEPGI